MNEFTGVIVKLVLDRGMQTTTHLLELVETVTAEYALNGDCTSILLNLVKSNE